MYNDDDTNKSSSINQVEIGYFQTLNANFRSTEEDIRKYFFHSFIKILVTICRRQQGLTENCKKQNLCRNLSSEITLET